MFVVLPKCGAIRVKIAFISGCLEEGKRKWYSLQILEIISKGIDPI